VSNTTPYNTPQPKPVQTDASYPIWPSVVLWVRDNVGTIDATGEANLDGFIKEMEARDAFGLEKYGQHLCAFDGRDTMIDQMQEAFDGLVYSHKAVLEAEALRVQGVQPAISLATLRDMRARWLVLALGIFICLRQRDQRAQAQSAHTLKN
jgi:hypothetical protein